MIIFTTPEISKIKPIRQSSTIHYGGVTRCLAEVHDEFDLVEEVMDMYNISFWWTLGPGYIDGEQWDLEDKFNGGLVEGIEWIYGLSKESNIALAIYQISNHYSLDPFELWEMAVKKPQIPTMIC